jgi:hypothetical protein
MDVARSEFLSCGFTEVFDEHGEALLPERALAVRDPFVLALRPNLMHADDVELLTAEQLAHVLEHRPLASA